MPPLNFYPQFADQVESGQKLQSIRKIGGIPWKVGDKAHLFTGLRTKACRKLGVGVVADIVRVAIAEHVLWVDQDFFTQWRSFDKFAQADGFSHWNEMTDWFREIHGLPFHGVLIRWELEEQPNE